MAGVVPTILDAMPDSESYNVARPLFGRTVSTMTNGINYLCGFRGLRFIQQQCINLATSVINDVPLPGLMTNDPTIRWVVSPVASYVWWGAWIAADKYGSAPRVQVYLETVAGVLIDGPIEFTTANGKLPSDYYSVADRGASMSRDRLIHTGWATQTTSTAPRLLDVSGHRGVDVQIRIVANDTQVYSHWALEAYQSSI